MSRIPWGTELRLDASGQHLLYKTGAEPWRSLEAIIPDATLTYVKGEFHRMWGSSRRYNQNGDGIPDVWVLNDFGPIAINYFRDGNHNRKLNRGERIMGEMIHTTPDNQGQTDKGQAPQLGFSHGCIHVRPADLARLQKQGAFKVGELLFVHKPSEVVWEDLIR